MGIEQRVDALKRHISAILNDDTRYAIAARIREFGYIDFRDFFQARPAIAHVAELERLVTAAG